MIPPMVEVYICSVDEMPLVRMTSIKVAFFPAFNSQAQYHTANRKALINASHATALIDVSGIPLMVLVLRNQCSCMTNHFVRSQAVNEHPAKQIPCTQNLVKPFHCNEIRTLIDKPLRLIRSWHMSVK